eukprot:1178693-Pleurochrysis_carterae.AAC.1
MLLTVRGRTLYTLAHPARNNLGYAFGQLCDGAGAGTSRGITSDDHLPTSILPARTTELRWFACIMVG